MTLKEVADKANAIYVAHQEAASYDNGFDAGEFSGPAHDRDADREVNELCVASGFSREEVDSELFRRSTADKEEPIDPFAPGIYIFGADLATGHVGPFATEGEALARLELHRERGDASVIHHGLSGKNALRTAEQARHEAQEAGYKNLTSPEEDIEPDDSFGPKGLPEDSKLPRDASGRRVAVGDKVHARRYATGVIEIGTVANVRGQHDVVLDDGRVIETADYAIKIVS